MKKLYMVVMSMSLFLISACAKPANKNNAENNYLNGDWVSNNADNSNDVIKLTIQGKKALASKQDETEQGTINYKRKTIEFKDSSGSDVWKYALMGKKLSLTIDGDAYLLKRGDKAQVKNTAKDVNFNSIGTYAAGTDINPGSYDVDFSYNDNDDKSTKGNATLTITNGKEKVVHRFHATEHSNSSSIKLTIKSGDRLTYKGNGDGSELEFTASDIS